MNTCKRNFTKEQIIKGLKAGHTLMVDRRDAPELEDLLELERQGLVTQELIIFDEQSSAIKWKWKSSAPEGISDRLGNFDAYGDRIREPR